MQMVAMTMESPTSDLSHLEEGLIVVDDSDTFTIAKLKAELEKKKNDKIIVASAVQISQLLQRLSALNLRVLGMMLVWLSSILVFHHKKTLAGFFKSVEPTAQNKHSPYYVLSDTLSLAGRSRCMPVVNKLFMFLRRLRLGLT